MLKASLERMVALQALILTELLNPVAEFCSDQGRLAGCGVWSQFTDGSAFRRKDPKAWLLGSF